MAKIFTITDGLENMGALRSGGQGSVYKARRTGAIVTAVKIIPTPIYNESAEDKNFRNFINEVEKLKKVNQEPNPNVVKILSSGITESGSFPYIEMEYIEGPDLEELLKSPHDPVFTIKEAIKVADQLACALSHCHKIGVRHGDIKSNNVKFNINSGNYVLLDFGLAVMSDEQRRSSLRHAGAIEFMAPEQNEGQMFFQTDVYSFGVILFELLTGQVPFPLADNGETSRNSVMLQHMEAPVPDLLILRQKNLPISWPQDKKDREMLVPDWLVKLIYRCLEKIPENRYANGAVLHEVISLQSISGGTNAELAAENERLRQELTDLKEKAAQPIINPVTRRSVRAADDSDGSFKDLFRKRGVRISRNEVVATIIFILALLAIAITQMYSAHNKQKQIGVLKDSLAVALASIPKQPVESDYSTSHASRKVSHSSYATRAVRNAEASRATQNIIEQSLAQDSLGKTGQDSIARRDSLKRVAAHRRAVRLHREAQHKKKKKKFLGILPLP